MARLCPEYTFHTKCLEILDKIQKDNFSESLSRAKIPYQARQDFSKLIPKIISHLFPNSLSDK